MKSSVWTHNTEQILLLAQPSVFFFFTLCLYFSFTLSLHTQTHTKRTTLSLTPSFLLKERRRRKEEEEEEGAAISFRVLAHLIGSWQHMEP